MVMFYATPGGRGGQLRTSKLRSLHHSHLDDLLDKLGLAGDAVPREVLQHQLASLRLDIDEKQ